MQTEKLKPVQPFQILAMLCLVLLGVGCDDDKEYSGLAEGYVVGSFIADELNADGQATGNKTPRGYCILLEGNENESMDFYTFNFPDELFSFPDDILTPSYNGYNCGPNFFPDSVKYSYKIKFKYQIVDKPGKIQFMTDCLALSRVFSWDNYNQITLNETAKN